MSMSVYVCVCVCLFAKISQEPHALSLYYFLCMLLMAVARSSSGRVTKSHGEDTDNALYSKAFRPIQKRLNRPRCRLG